MTRRSNFPLSGLLFSLLATLLLVPFLGTAASADPSDPADPASPAGPGVASPATPEEVAEQALETVEELLDPAAPAALTADGEGPDLTLALRDLAASRVDLPKDKQDDAARLLARPTDGINSTDPDSSECYLNNGPPCYRTAESTPLCTGDICVHYVDGSDPNRTDSENNGAGGRWAGSNPAYPDYVEYVADVFSRIAFRYEQAGYDRPAGDGSIGGGGMDKVDIYIAELGFQGVYGYCATDREVVGHVAAPAYCVVDNNFKASEFPGQTPAENLQVTAAHEYFHAVQFAYDFNEDGWLLEATATWVEDEIYDNINDNRQYLSAGPLGVPEQALDTWSGLAQYGEWIFFRFLTERYPTKTGALPNIIRTIWERAGNEQYSVQAIKATLAAKGGNLTDLFARFAVWNRQPARYYAEGAAYRPAPLRASYKLSATAPGKTVVFGLDHLSSKSLRFVPTMTGAWQLRIRLNLNSSAAGGAAMVTYKPKGKAAVVKLVPLSSDGNGLVVHPFGSRVEWVEVAAVNASSRYVRCNTPSLDYTYTCQGLPQDDNVRQGLIVRAVRG